MTSAALAALPSPGAYARFLRRVAEAAKADSAARVSVPMRLDGTFGHCRTVADVVRETRKALHRRINLRGGLPDSYGRLDTCEGRTGMIRDVTRVRELKAHRCTQFSGGFDTKTVRERLPALQAMMRRRFE